jgi:hypothetical protein
MKVGYTGKIKYSLAKYDDNSNSFLLEFQRGFVPVIYEKLYKSNCSISYK